MMNKILLGISLVIIVFLSGCSDDASAYNFKVRKDYYLISDDEAVIIEYKTNEDGKLVNLFIDRLIPIEDMIYFNPLIDFDYTLEGFTGDIFTIAGYTCTKHANLRVPINIEIGSTKFKYVRTDCEYQEVDRNNIVKTGTYAERYKLTDTLGFSQDTEISIVVYDAFAVVKFIEILNLANSVKTLGVYSIGLNSDLDGFTSNLTNYYKEIAIYEQLMLKLQDNDLAISEVSGFTEDINILDLNNFGDITPLIEDFETLYASEIQAIFELEDLIGVVSETEVTDIDDDTNGDETT